MKKFKSLEIKEFVSSPLFDEDIILNKDKSWPRISIVTPSLNQANFLERTILSVLNQNYPNLEYIIIDGGSTDRSIDIIKKYKKYITYWISETDNGQADAINKGLKIATGKILAYLNADDTYCMGTLKMVANHFNNHPDTHMVYGDYILIDAQDNVIKYKKEIEFDYNVLLYGFSYIPQPTVFFRRTIIDNIGFFNATLNCTMDCDYWIRVGRKYRIKHLPFFLANFRLHRDSKTSTEVPIFKKEGLNIRKKYVTGCPNSLKACSLYLKFFRIIYKIKRIYLKFSQGCYRK